MLQNLDVARRTPSEPASPGLRTLQFRRPLPSHSDTDFWSAPYWHDQPTHFVPHTSEFHPQNENRSNTGSPPTETKSTGRFRPANTPSWPLTSKICARSEERRVGQEGRSRWS